MHDQRTGTGTGNHDESLGWATNEGLNVVAVVAHPDDETLWCGGLILGQPRWRWHILGLCRGSDADRAPRFYQALQGYGASGTLADLDDGPDQSPLDQHVIEETILKLLPPDPLDLVITHGPHGEYTRHRRHEECCVAIVDLWQSGRLETTQLWMFAFEDAGGLRLPHADPAAPCQRPLMLSQWREKRRILTQVYGFAPDSWEVRAAPREEAFWCFGQPREATEHLMRRGHRT